MVISFFSLPITYLDNFCSQVIFGNHDVTMEQALIVANSFGSATRYTYNLVLTYFEFKPIQQSKYLNIMYPLDKYTWSLLLLSLLVVAGSLFYLSPRKEQLKVWTLLSHRLIEDIFYITGFQF